MLKCLKKPNRKREIRWGLRTLDVDVLWVEGEKVNEPDLMVRIENERRARNDSIR